ncbi:MAG TPA: hypothetical protein VGF59_33890, partial [Bryobacteraceae bacterium]
MPPRLRGGLIGEFALERQPHITDIPKTPARVPSQAELDRATNRQRDIRRRRVHIYVALEHPRERARRVFSAEGAPARDHFVEHAAERPYVRTLVHR